VPFALILTDLNMPVVDGYGVIAHRNKTCPQVPLFVMSGDLYPEVREKLCEMRVSGCVEKPFSFEQIMEIMEYELEAGSIDTIRNKRPRLQPAARSMVPA
jgi:CheY-like chemotaxis protein